MRPRLVTGAAIGALLLAGCASTSGESVSDEAPTGSNAPAASAPADPASAEDEQPSPPEPEPAPSTPSVQVLSFGQTMTYEDGLSITISPPVGFAPSNEWSRTQFAEHVAFDVKIVNGSPEPFDPVGAYFTLQSGNVEGEQVFDSEGGFTGGPSTALLPGREAVWKIGFGVQNPADIVMEVTPGMFTYEDVIYATSP